MANYKIFINGAAFTAHEDTIDAVENALEAAGWKYNYSVEGFECPKTVSSNPRASDYVNRKTA